VRPSGLVVAPAVLVLGTAAALAASDPHKERERLRPADMALARRATIKAADLVSGWKRMPVGSDDDSKCPGFDPDFSAFTITGKASSLFVELGRRGRPLRGRGLQDAGAGHRRLSHRRKAGLREVHSPRVRNRRRARSR
jgi:hypothetical protein